MDKTKLTTAEKSLLHNFETGDFKRVRNFGIEKKRYEQYAAYSLSKPRNINIRLSERTLNKIKTLAAERGLPYQTFISSLLHQYSNVAAQES